MEFTVKSPKLLAVMQLASHCCDPLTLAQALVSMAVRVSLFVLVLALLGCTGRVERNPLGRTSAAAPLEIA